MSFNVSYRLKSTNSKLGKKLNNGFLNVSRSKIIAINEIIITKIKDKNFPNVKLDLGAYSTISEPFFSDETIVSSKENF